MSQVKTTSTDFQSKNSLHQPTINSSKSSQMNDNPIVHVTDNNTSEKDEVEESYEPNDFQIIEPRKGKRKRNNNNPQDQGKCRPRKESNTLKNINFNL